MFRYVTVCTVVDVHQDFGGFGLLSAPVFRVEEQTEPTGQPTSMNSKVVPSSLIAQPFLYSRSIVEKWHYTLITCNGVRAYANEFPVLAEGLGMVIVRTLATFGCMGGVFFMISGVWPQGILSRWLKGLCDVKECISVGGCQWMGGSLVGHFRSFNYIVNKGETN